MDSQTDIRITHRLIYRWKTDGKMDGCIKISQNRTAWRKTAKRWIDRSVDRKTLTIAPVPTVIFAVTSPVIRDTQFVGALKPVSEVARLIQS